MKKEVICTVCPRGCTITVEGEGEKILSVSGFQCKRGEEYASREFVNPVRILTTTVRIEGGKEPLLPVRSDAPLPKGSLMDCMKAIRSVTVKAPVKRYDVILPDVCGTGVNIVATKEGEE